MHKRIFLLLLLASFLANGQQRDINSKAIDKGRKGEFYLYWGWNFSWYGKSDITFEGDNYNFTLDKVRAQDRQSKFSFDKYFNPKSITIPQYNFRLGYFISDHYNISFGIDHMKYVMQQNQTVPISGNINIGSSYDGVYSDEPIELTEDFLQFEHTDGLNYVNLSLRRFDEFYQKGFLTLGITEGIGIGVLYPKTNTALLNKERYDEFHLAGYGLDVMAGLNIGLFKHFFIQSELKAGFINLPNIRTTTNSSDKAKQNFVFGQFNFMFGGRFSF